MASLRKLNTNLYLYVFVDTAQIVPIQEITCRYDKLTLLNTFIHHFHTEGCEQIINSKP